MSSNKDVYFEMLGNIVDARITPDRQEFRVSLELTGWMVDRIPISAPATGDVQRAQERMRMHLGTLGHATGVVPFMTEQLIGKQPIVVLDNRLQIVGYRPFLPLIQPGS